MSKFIEMDYDPQYQRERAFHRAQKVSAPEDEEIKGLCERLGYGAVMDAASRLWIKKDPMGAFFIGGCVGYKDSEE